MDLEANEVGKPGLGDALRAPFLLLLWIVGFGAGIYVGVSWEIAIILYLPEHPVVAAAFPVGCLTAVALGVWRLPRFKQWLRPAAVGAALGAVMSGPIFLLGVEALAEF